MKSKLKMISLIAALWLMGCKCKEIIPPQSGVDGCLMFNEIHFSLDDKNALFQSGVSDSVILALKNHNDTYRAKCKKQ